MKDFTTHPALASFPWESVYRGLALSEKTVGTFNVGDIQKYGLENVKYQDMRPTDKRWYLALKHGFEIDGFNVNVTESKTAQVLWFRSCDPSCWRPSKNYPHFTDLLQWIDDSKIFKHTGRILFFITLQGQFSPPHVDFIYNGIGLPPGFKTPEFLWITPPDNPKQLLIQGERAPWACGFDPMLEHQTLPAVKTQWSLRIDGEYA